MSNITRSKPCTNYAYISQTPALCAGLARATVSLADAQKSAEAVSAGGVHRSHQPRSEDTGVSAALTGSPSTSTHIAVPDADNSIAQSAPSPIDSRHNAICCDHQVLTLAADGQGHSHSVSGSMCVNGQAQQSEPQHIAATEARRSSLPLQRPTTLSTKQKTTQRVTKRLNIFRRPGRSTEADQGSRGTLSSIAEPDTAGLVRTSASEVAKQGFRPSQGEVKLHADASLQRNTQPGYQVGNAPQHSLQLCSVKDSEQGAGKCKSLSSLQHALSQGVNLSAVRVTEQSQAEQTPPEAGTMLVDNLESANVQPASKQEAQRQPIAQTSDRYIMLQLCLSLGENVSGHSNALFSCLSIDVFLFLQHR